MIDLDAIRAVIAEHDDKCVHMQGCCNIDDAAKQLIAEVERLRQAIADHDSCCRCCTEGGHCCDGAITDSLRRKVEA